MTTRSPALALLVTLTLACGLARADVTAEWRKLAASEIDRASMPATQRAATLQRVEEALARVHGAANSNGNGGGAEAGHKHQAAVAVATFAVLETMLPQSREELANRLAITFSRIPENDAKAEGAALGRRIAAEILSRR